MQGRTLSGVVVLLSVLASPCLCGSLSCGGTLALPFFLWSGIVSCANVSTVHCHGLHCLASIPFADTLYYGSLFLQHSHLFLLCKGTSGAAIGKYLSLAHYFSTKFQQPSAFSFRHVGEGQGQRKGGIPKFSSKFLAVGRLLPGVFQAHKKLGSWNMLQCRTIKP